MMILLCPPGAMGCTMSACQIALHKYQDERDAPGFTALRFSCHGWLRSKICLRDQHAKEKLWTLRLQQSSLGRDISHVVLQFAAREKAHPMWPLVRDSEACAGSLRTLPNESPFPAALLCILCCNEL